MTEQPPGFEPIAFDLAGKIVLGIGVAGFILVIFSPLNKAFNAPAWVGIFSLLAVAAGLYMIYIPGKPAG